jgi:hypothetical protein
MPSMKHFFSGSEIKVRPLPGLDPASAGHLKEAGTGIRPHVGEGLHPIRETII